HASIPIFRVSAPAFAGRGGDSASATLADRARKINKQAKQGAALLAGAQQHVALRGSWRRRTPAPRKLGLLGALLRLRLAGLFARRLAGGRRGELVEPGLEQRGPRLGKAQGAIAVDALLGIVPADVIALAGEAVLIANQVRRLRAVGGAVLDQAHRPGHRLLGLGA